MSIPILNNLDLNRNQLLNALLQVLAAAPGTPTPGQLWYNSTSGKIEWRDATAVRAAQRDDVRLDQIAAPTAAVGLNGQKLTGLADGTAATDAATRGQLDAVAAGLDIKPSVRAASTANIALTGTQTIDGVAVVAGDRVLVKNQTAPAENGIYVVAAGAWARATDVDAWAEIPGALVAVEQGTANADNVYLFTADQGGTLGTTAVTISKFGAGGAGTVNKFAADITGDGAATQFTVMHNLGTTDVTIAVYDVAADLAVIVDKKRPTANTVRIDFAAAPANLKVYRVVCTG